MTQAILVDQFRKTYPRTWKTPPFEAVKGISFMVSEGEVFGFIGPNGAGKSTTIKVLTGATPASSGHISIYGMDASLPESRRGMGYVPENPSLPDYLTPLEMLMMSVSINALKIPNTRAHCLKWLDRFGISFAANKLMRGFSKGMLQRAALAHGLVANPRLLVLDEPLSGLDPIGRRDVVEILAEFKAGGGSIFLTSHVLHDVERLADRFGLIHKGELKTIAAPNELMGDEEILIVRSQGNTPVTGMSQDTQDRWSAQCTRGELWPLLHRLEQARHQILEVKPMLNLENAFLKFVEER
jgi:ABC-2 type transport system ATP-binding protein